MASDAGRALRVGLLVLAALAALAAGIFLIGEKNQLFTLKQDYFTRFATVSGLSRGNPVQLNGVEVGSVTGIVLPESPDERLIRVDLTVDERYAERIRGDSQARLKTLGLLGDKYVEITSGSPTAPQLAAGAEIPSAAPTELDALVASGEDVMANITEISASLKVILARMERGEGLLGELVSNPETGKRVTDTLVETMDSIKEVASKVEHGKGALPRLITDDQLADRLSSAVDRLDAVLAAFEEGDGLLPTLLNDAETRESFTATLASLKTSSEELAAFTHRLEDADGLMPKLLFDEEYGRRLTTEIQQTTARLDNLSQKLDGGDGTLAKLIDDPSVYDALQDVIVGVNESKLLRWLIRNRQKAGIRKRYEEAQQQPEASPAPPPPTP
jgi:phospholipid/cholesterol/gamma-HCH transport system substrate-binding protein